MSPQPVPSDATTDPASAQPTGAAEPVDALASFRLDGRVAIVTGASSGLGNRFARVLHGAGAHVVVAARRRGPLEELARDLGDRCTVTTADVADPDDCRRLVDTAVEAGDGQLHLLVNNAGASNTSPAEDEDFEDFRRLIDVNLNSVFLLSQLAYRPMVASGGGTIVNVASMLGMVAGTPIKQASYCASKGGVVNLTRELAAQWARRGVRVNALAPGWFHSEMTGTMWGDEASERFVTSRTPMGREGAEHELDGALLFLASDASTFVVGQTLTVDGGWTII